MTISSPPVEYNPFVEPHQSNPGAFYDWALREAPVAYSRAVEAWVVSRYDDVLAVLTDPRRFSSLAAIPNLYHNPPEVVEILRAGGVPERDAMTVNNDPPEHTRLRRILGRVMSPRRFLALEPAIRRLADELIDEFVADGRVELAARFINPLPSRVISELLGIPRDAQDRVEAWVRDMLTLLNPLAPLAAKLPAAHGMVEYAQFIFGMIRERRAAPGDDYLSELIHTRIDGYAPLTDDELVHLFREQRAAGVDSTRGGIANALLNLFEHPDLLAALRAEPELLPRFVEETLRRDHPQRGTVRVTTEELELGGVRLPKGSRLLLLFSAACRDPARFACPERFDMQRPDLNEHLGFGKGPHTCPGSALGRLELRVALEALLARLPDLRPAPGFVPRYLPSHIFVTIERLDVEFTPSAASAHA